MHLKHISKSRTFQRVTSSYLIKAFLLFILDVVTIEPSSFYRGKFLFWRLTRCKSTLGSGKVALGVRPYCMDESPQKTEEHPVCWVPSTINYAETTSKAAGFISERRIWKVRFKPREVQGRNKRLLVPGPLKHVLQAGWNLRFLKSRGQILPLRSRMRERCYLATKWILFIV